MCFDDCIFSLQLAQDYRWHALEVDVSDRIDVGDDFLRAIGSAQVRWQRLNLSGTMVTEAGLRVLVKNCPELLVR